MATEMLSSERAKMSRFFSLKPEKSNLIEDLITLFIKSEFQTNEKSSYISEITTEVRFLTQGGGLAPFLLFLFPGTSENVKLFNIRTRLN